MILIVGGARSGKKTYARGLAARHGWGEDELAFDAEELLWDAGAPAGRRALEAEADLLEALAAKKAVTCTLVGGGIVPLDPDEAAWREAAGRMQCALAGRAQAVVRMTCGIPQPVKGDLA